MIPISLINTKNGKFSEKTEETKSISTLNSQFSNLFLKKIDFNKPSRTQEGELFSKWESNSSKSKENLYFLKVFIFNKKK